MTAVMLTQFCRAVITGNDPGVIDIKKYRLIDFTSASGTVCILVYIECSDNSFYVDFLIRLNRKLTVAEQEDCCLNSSGIAFNQCLSTA
ncbi:hypothetical protein A7D21_29000 [Pseudomonas sp. AP19]|nr:hypothetical protein A7D21_29000 [Pseudomonas sp. AP19]